MSCPSLSKISICVLGSVITSIGSCVLALPVNPLGTVGFIGGVVSITLTGCEVVLFGCSALSVAFAKILPSGIGTLGVIVTWPCSSVVPEPMILPSLSTISTCVLGSVVTEIGVNVPPFSEISVSKVGAFGGVVSVAFTGSDVELFGCSA